MISLHCDQFGDKYIRFFPFELIEKAKCVNQTMCKFMCESISICSINRVCVLE